MKRSGILQKRQQIQAEGQSLVEMSIILPLLLIIVFGIIDIGYYVYSYATVYQAARRGSDLAAYYPPYVTRLDGADIVDPDTGETRWDPDAYDMSDKCVYAVVAGTQKGAILVDLSDIDHNRDHFSILYFPAPDQEADMEAEEPRKPGKTVQVAITHTVDPLTPLFGLVPVFGNQGKMTVYAKSMRTIQGRGESFPQEGAYNNSRIICEE
jgi:Flp pilus assembly protein TadG